MRQEGFKQRVYGQFARIGHAVASEKRLELLDLLAQAPRHVEALVALTAIPVASVSQHLQVLRGAGLVETERDGTKVIYRIAGPEVLRLWLTLAGVAELRLAEVANLVRAQEANSGGLMPFPRATADAQPDRAPVLLLDVRPRVEFDHAHLRGAVSVPLDELTSRLDELPRDRAIVTYCRGTYCLMADEAAAILRERGYDAVRLEGGWPEWLVEGRPVE